MKKLILAFVLVLVVLSLVSCETVSHDQTSGEMQSLGELNEVESTGEKIDEELHSRGSEMESERPTIYDNDEVIEWDIDGNTMYFSKNYPDSILEEEMYLEDTVLPESFFEESGVLRQKPDMTYGELWRFLGTEETENSAYFVYLNAVLITPEGEDHNTEFPEHIYHLRSIKEMQFEKPPGQHTEWSTFPNLFWLEEVYFTSSNIGSFESLGEEISQMQSLKKLEIIGGYFSEFPDVFQDMPNLEELILIEVPLMEELPPSFYTLEKLRILTLHPSGIRTLDEEIGELKTLEKLSIGNSLISLPESLFQLSNLKELNLGSAEIVSFPQGVENLANLETLSIAALKLDCIPRSVQSLQEERHDLLIVMLPEDTEPCE